MDSCGDGGVGRRMLSTAVPLTATLRTQECVTASTASMPRVVAVRLAPGM